MLKVKASDPNQMFGIEFGDPHFFLLEAQNIYKDYIFKKKLVDIHMRRFCLFAFTACLSSMALLQGFVTWLCSMAL